MLKRLELVGFKSFADKTEFDFPAGVTGIVGPNGSGKSNVVDAVRWVLGEQSAKSLRGGEMIDVIFNGSASRRGVGCAEVTMTLDNHRRALATEADEVQITRRVWRDGQGEYLINGTPCRLKDIKDLFLGSGAGTDAYSIIEQGRVDILLQASTKERRTIFEEAAGISRFKVRKIEALRKLERVEQNLSRLRDILQEVEKQLRSVKLQAAKAQRWQEYTNRLRELRVALGLREYHDLAGKLDAGSARLAELRAELETQFREAEQGEQALREMETAVASLDERIHAREADQSTAREEIAAAETTLAREWGLVHDLEADLAQSRRQAIELKCRVAGLAETLALAAAELQADESIADQARAKAEELDAILLATESRWSALQNEIASEKTEHLERMRQTARLQNEAVSYKASLDNLGREHERLRQRTAQVSEHLASIDLELQQLSVAGDDVQTKLNDAKQSLNESRQERDQLLQQRDEATQRAADRRAERSGLSSRIEVLEGLERSHEGLGAGGREVFDLLAQADPGPWQAIVGLVADALSVRREYAPLIDLAMGERSQFFLVRDMAMLTDALRARGQPFSSRVGFLPVHASTHAASPSPEPPSELPRLDDSDGPSDGLISRADQLVTCDDPTLADLPGRLLGRTLVVRDLPTARALIARQPGYRCVTLAGELLEADGSLTVGTHHAESGLLSRRSELRELRQQTTELDRRIIDIDQELAQLRERIRQAETKIEDQNVDVAVFAEQYADLRSRIVQRQQRRQGLHEEVTVSQTEISSLESEMQQLERRWRAALEEAASAEARVQEIQQRLEAADVETRELESARQQQQQQATAARIALAQADERLHARRARYQAVAADVEQRQHELHQREQRLAQAGRRLVESQQTLLNAYSSLAVGCLRKEEAERCLAAWMAERDALRARKQELADATQANRATWRERQEQAHACELEVNDLHHRRDTLCARLREDYQLELMQLYDEARQAEPSPLDAPLSTADGPSPEEEIEELRKKLSRLGSVNLEALDELTGLEARASSLQIQHDDLAAAERHLQEIIEKINTDSRKLFLDSFTTIRGHFQELFRKLFGGGMAEIVLEDENDVLESGIEIVARPPGKELRSISLMSGGEKTMTAVALLMAIFRSRPSPFCILDEVDAALDEANIGRFTGVLREFLDRSQFILITHSKRTMACADVLYGVTMQESGISKRFAVRFEDWPDDEAQADDPAA